MSRRWLLVVSYTLALPWLVFLWDRAAPCLGHGASMFTWLAGMLMAVTAVVMLARMPAGRQQWFYLFAACVLGAIVCAMATFPAERLHVPEYMLMAVFVSRALYTCRAGRAFWALVICSLLGVLDEVMQGLIPARFFDVRDIVANGMAALAGVFAWRAFGGTADWSVPRSADCLLVFLQAGLLLLLVMALSASPVPDAGRLAWMPRWQAVLLMLWATVHGVVAFGKPADGPRVALLAASAAQGFVAAAVLLGIPFV